MQAFGRWIEDVAVLRGDTRLR